MNVQLVKAAKEDREALAHLFQYYIYDFSEFIKCDVEDDGRFGPYPYLYAYWEEDHVRFPYFIRIDGKYAGFVLVRLIEAEPQNYFSIAEFFVMKKYRRSGIGKTAAFQVFDLHRGQWEVFQLESNKPAYAFWKKVIGEYTNGQFTERPAEGKTVQAFMN